MKIAMVVAIALAGLSGARAQDMKAERDRIVAAADARRDAREALSKDRASGNRAALSEDRQ